MDYMSRIGRNAMENGPKLAQVGGACLIAIGLTVGSIEEVYAGGIVAASGLGARYLMGR